MKVRVQHLHALIGRNAEGVPEDLKRRIKLALNGNTVARERVEAELKESARLRALAGIEESS